ncbi:MAG: response regulator [Verrucomicrobia subdivision 3 bacterium]|nr:response regulator [Limisphaerales bacterium]
MYKILVIEDECQMRKNICTILQMEEFEVISAKDGREGVEKALSEKPDLILCDLMMPELDGEGVFEALNNSSDDNAPFIFLTARGNTAFFRRELPGGADGYLMKPITADELLKVVTSKLPPDSNRRDAETQRQMTAEAATSYESPKTE